MTTNNLPFDINKPDDKVDSMPEQLGC